MLLRALQEQEQIQQQLREQQGLLITEVQQHQQNLLLKQTELQQEVHIPQHTQDLPQAVRIQGVHTTEVHVAVVLQAQVKAVHRTAVTPTQEVTEALTQLEVPKAIAQTITDQAAVHHQDRTLHLTTAVQDRHHHLIPVDQDQVVEAADQVVAVVADQAVVVAVAADLVAEVDNNKLHLCLVQSL